MTRAFAAVAALLPTLLRDAAGIAGAALIAYGAWQVFRPAGFITAGALMLAGVLRLARSEET